MSLNIEDLNVRLKDLDFTGCGKTLKGVVREAKRYALCFRLNYLSQ